MKVDTGDDSRVQQLNAYISGAPQPTHGTDETTLQAQRKRSTKGSNKEGEQQLN